MDVISLSAFVFFFNVFALKRVGCTLTKPGELSGTFDEKASFEWNSTIELMEASWGLCSSDLKSISSRFVLVEADGIPKYEYSYLNSSRYKGRVQYVGDISKGQAWFVIKNLRYEDAVPYCAKLTEGPKESPGNTYYPNVTLKVIAAPTTTSPPTTATTSTKTTPGSNITTTSTTAVPTTSPNITTTTTQPPIKPPKTGLHGGAIAGIVCAGLVLCGACIGGGCYCYKKSKKSSGQNGSNSDVVLKNKVDKEANDNRTQPSA